MIHSLRRLWAEDEAQNLSEFALLLVLVSLTAVIAMGSLASRINGAYSSASIHVVASGGGDSMSGGGGGGFTTSSQTRDSSSFRADKSTNLH